MTRPTDTYAAPNTGKGVADQRITTCKLCGHGIYARQTTIWLRTPMGLSHADTKDCDMITVYTVVTSVDA